MTIDGKSVEMKKYQTILTEKQQKYQHYHQVNKYYHLIIVE